MFTALGLIRCRYRLLWSMNLSSCWVASSLGRSGPFQQGGPSQPLLNQIWDLVLRRSYKDKLFKVEKIWTKMPTMDLQCVFTALGLKRCKYWLLWHEFIWCLLVSALDVCWAASSLGRSGPFRQPLLNQIWDLVYSVLTGKCICLFRLFVPCSACFMCDWVVLVEEKVWSILQWLHSGCLNCHQDACRGWRSKFVLQVHTPTPNIILEMLCKTTA